MVDTILKYKQKQTIKKKQVSFYLIYLALFLFIVLITHYCYMRYWQLVLWSIPWLVFM